MAITTRAGKGSALTHAELDANFTTIGLSHGATTPTLINIAGINGSSDYIPVTYNSTGTGGIRLYDSGNVIQGTWYGSGGGEHGFLDNDGSWAVRIRTGSNAMILYCNGNPEFYVYTSYTYSPGSSRAPIFYDSNNTAYYANPASTSVFNTLSLASLSVTSDVTISGDLYVAGGNVHVASGNDRLKYTLWGDNDNSFGIGMGSGYTFGGLSDYAMTFQMNDDSARGFWWGDASHTDAQGAMSLTTDGHLAVANTVKIGYGESNTSAASYDLDVSGNGHITGSLHVGSYIYHDGDTNSYLRFVAADDVQLVAGGRQMLRMDEGTDPDKLRFVTDDNWTNSSGTWNMSGNVTSGGSFIANSDERLKSDIETITDALDKVKSLRGTSYVKNDRAEIGVIAQEVESIIPEVVHTADDEMGTKSVAYGNLVGLLIEAIKEQQSQIDQLITEIKSLKEK